MFARLIPLCSAFLFACALTVSSPGPVLAGNDGIVKVKSAYMIGETVERLKKDIADKGINCVMIENGIFAYQRGASQNNQEGEHNKRQESI